MTARSTRLGAVMPPKANINEERVQIHATQKVAKMERVLSATPDHAHYLKALATLRGWQVDPTLDPAAREKASGLVWRFQPNGWDEV